jgi:hypothetical protein
MTAMNDERFEVPSPWDMTHASRRDDTVHEQGTGPRERKDAVTALEALAPRLAAGPSVDWNVVPARLLDGWFFTALHIARAIPLLSDYHPDAVVEWLRAQGFTKAAEEAGPAIASAWLATVEKGIAHDAARWLRAVSLYEGGLDDAESARLVAVARRYWSQLDDEVAAPLLDAAAAAAPALAAPLLREVRDNPAAGPEARRVAEAATSPATSPGDMPEGPPKS